MDTTVSNVDLMLGVVNSMAAGALLAVAAFLALHALALTFDAVRRPTKVALAAAGLCAAGAALLGVVGTVLLAVAPVLLLLGLMIGALVVTALTTEWVLRGTLG